MNAKLQRIPAVAATVFLFWGIMYASATASEAEAGPMLWLFGVGIGCAMIAVACWIGEKPK